jgi:predicted  nucleic acid-binding Zn-ribbon protein
VDNEKFQELVLAQFGEMNKQFEKIDQQFEKIDQRFEKIDQRFDGIESQIKDLKGLALQHHKETELIALRIDKLIENENEIEDLFIKRRQKA